MRILIVPNQILRTKCGPVKAVDKQLRLQVREMFNLMYAAGGVGLAANQVGIPLRFFILNNTGRDERVFINPVLSFPKGTSEEEEGCLSIPGIRGRVIRPAQIRVNAWALDGSEIDERLGGLLARCIQHEIDHLDGVLFTDKCRKG